MDIQKNRPVKDRTKTIVAFISAYLTCGRVGPACEKAGITRLAHYKLLDTDPEYRAAFEAAGKHVGQILEDEAVRRSMKGDTPLLLALLKRFRPELYRERASIDITGEVTIRDALNEARARVIALERNDRTGTKA
jgi:hypothetical protein